MADIFDVIVVGSLHLDIMVKGPHLPAIDETVIGEAWSFRSGGKGGNQARAAAQAGARTAMVGCIGNDDFGRQLMADLDAAGVDRSRVASDPQAGSGMSVAIETADGAYGAVIVSGANLNIRSAQLAGLTARVLVLQNEISPDINLEAARLAKRSGAYVLHNSAPFLPFDPDIRRHIDLVVANRVEAASVTGIAIGTLESAMRAAKALSLGGGSAIVTAGELGCALCGHGGVSKTIPAIAVTAVSTHGAGDVFCGALAACIARGKDVISAAEDASLAAAKFVAGGAH